MSVEEMNLERNGGRGAPKKDVCIRLKTIERPLVGTYDVGKIETSDCLGKGWSTPYSCEEGK